MSEVVAPLACGYGRHPDARSAASSDPPARLRDGAELPGVLSYTEPFSAHDWKRMTLYRATDAADTMNMAALLIAAYRQRSGMRPDTLESYLQLSQQRDRAAGPGDGEWAQLAGLLGEDAPACVGG